MSYPYSATYTVSAGDTILAVHYNTGNSDHINNNIPESIDDYSANAAEMQATTDPYPASAVSLPTTLDGELQRLRYVIKQLSGEAHWYIDPSGGSLSALTPASLTLAGSAWPSFNVSLSANQLNITSVDQIEFDTEAFDTNSDYNTTTWEFIPTVAGKYLLSASITWFNLVAGDTIRMFIYKNGANYKQSTVIAGDTEGENTITVVVDANGVDDDFRVYAQNADRDTSDITGATITASTFSGCRIG